MSDLKKLFENYDSSGPIPQQWFSNKDLTNNPELLQKHISELKSHPRIKNLIEIINSAIDAVKKDAKELIDKFNIDIHVTAEDKISEPILNAVNFDFNSKSGEKESLEVSANFNVIKLALMPAPEAYSCVYSELYNPLLKKKQSMAGVDDYKFGKKVDVDFSRQNDNKGLRRDGLFEYLKEFICAVLGIEKTEAQSSGIDLSANNISRHFAESEITQQHLFDNPNGLNLFAERFSKVSKQCHQQQATALLGVFSKDEFKAVMNGSDQEIKQFCQKFSHQFLQNSGLSSDTYSIVFRNSGDLGVYRDFGERQEISINIQEIRKLKNPAEVVMTLAHELTHMVDSSVNKGIGNVSRKGYGLSEHNLVGSVGANSVGFIRKMENVYYKINPHERSARHGELVALDFMMGMQPDATMKRYIERSKEGFKSYQRDVINAFGQVDSLIEEYDKMELSNKSNLTAEEKYIVKVMEDMKIMCADKAKVQEEINRELRALDDANKAGMVEPTVNDGLSKQ